MRLFTISRLTLLEITGWMTLGLLFWLLLSTHNVLATPLTTMNLMAEESTTILLPPASIAGEGSQPSTASRTAAPRTNDLFWQTRLRLRHDLPVRGMLGNWLPNRNRYTLTERRRTVKASPSKPKAVILPRHNTQMVNLGPAIGRIYSRSAI